MAESPKVVITGGGGYVGHRLGCHLAQSGSWGRVVLFDWRPPHPSLPIPQGLEFQQGDIRNADDVSAALQGASLVFHVASYGMSGKEAMERATIRQVNMVGTENVVRACLAAGVPRLVYVSTYNVCFDSKTVVHNGDEASAQYVQPGTCHDTYSVTKALAEQLVLAADKQPFDRGVAAAGSTPTATTSTGRSGVATRSATGVLPGAAPGGARVLRTCAVRPAGIYGPGEQRHVPRIIRMARSGLLQFTFGDPDALVDWLHVDNLIQALVLAARGLSAEARCVAGGQAYFVSDGQPIPNFAFLRQIVEPIGYRWPAINLPYALVARVAVVLEAAAGVCAAAGIRFEPMLNRTEVAKCAVTHYYKIDKARTQLGYNPQAYNLSEVAAWYRDNGYGPQPLSAWQWVLRLALVVVLVAVVMRVLGLGR
mmetsp:Transcript_15618/g.38871  ORF Transcript_15618/g.38871 Transcript_15618/m.38871 type:complete len:424 (-) Transcript_15618:176-1447(-)